MITAQEKIDRLDSLSKKIEWYSYISHADEQWLVSELRLAWACLELLEKNAHEAAEQVQSQKD